jgi:hypothetical protein
MPRKIKKQSSKTKHNKLRVNIFWSLIEYSNKHNDETKSLGFMTQKSLQLQSTSTTINHVNYFSHAVRAITDECEKMMVFPTHQEPPIETVNDV